MHIDPEQLREQYDSLSDEALLQIHRADLIEDARRIYDDELARRQLVAARIKEESSSPEAADAGTDFPLDEDHPAWLAEAAEVFSIVDLPGRVPAPEAEKVRDVLLAAGIRCHLELTEVQDTDSENSQRQWRVLVPGQLNLYPASALARDIYNYPLEPTGKTPLQPSPY